MLSKPLSAAPPKPKKANMDLLEHDAKRKVELELTLLRDQLEEDGLDDEDEIDKKIAKKRKELMAAIKIVVPDAEGGSHQKALAKEAELDKMADALGINKDGKVGEAFNRELQEQKKLERMKE